MNPLDSLLIVYTPFYFMFVLGCGSEFKLFYIRNLYIIYCDDDLSIENVHFPNETEISLKIQQIHLSPF
jgi:hypothetical protein